jgi:hypothetical protein
MSGLDAIISCISTGSNGSTVMMTDARAILETQPR